MIHSKYASLRNYAQLPPRMEQLIAVAKSIVRPMARVSNLHTQASDRVDQAAIAKAGCGHRSFLMIAGCRDQPVGITCKLHPMLSHSSLSCKCAQARCAPCLCLRLAASSSSSSSSDVLEHMLVSALRPREMQFSWPPKYEGSPPRYHGTRAENVGVASILAVPLKQRGGSGREERGITSKCLDHSRSLNLKKHVTTPFEATAITQSLFHFLKSQSVEPPDLLHPGSC